MDFQFGFQQNMNRITGFQDRSVQQEEFRPVDDLFRFKIDPVVKGRLSRRKRFVVSEKTQVFRDPDSFIRTAAEDLIRHIASGAEDGGREFSPSAEGPVQKFPVVIFCDQRIVQQINPAFRSGETLD